MKPYYQHAGITIYHGDCREIMPLLEPFDLVLTDPPYGIGIAANPVRQKHEKANWDDAAPDAAVFETIRTLGKNQIIWGGNYFPLPPRKGFFIWDKVQPEDFSLAMCEMAWSSIDMPAKMFRYSVRRYTNRFHPTEKPEALMSWCIQFSDAATILDPFMGSGTTLRAAKDLRKKAVGIEIDERYCEVAALRMAQEVLSFGGAA